MTDNATTTMQHNRPSVVVLAVLLCAGGCAGLSPARMALPAALGAVVPETLQGIRSGRTGRFQLDGAAGAAGLAGSFERSASQLALFDALALAHATLRYTSSGAGGSVAASCRARQTSATLDSVTATPQPAALQCDFSGDIAGVLQLSAGRGGRATIGATVLDLQAVHQVQGSPLPLQAPIGYTFMQDGRVIGAVELNGTPRLWRPPAGTPAHAAVTQAALALALLWDPAGG